MSTRSLAAGRTLVERSAAHQENARVAAMNREFSSCSPTGNLRASPPLPGSGTLTHVNFAESTESEVRSGLLPQTGIAAPTLTVSELLDSAPTSRFHRQAVIVSGMGFFTDAYDLFVIGIVASLLKTQWNLYTTEISWVTGSAILGAFFGAFLFGRIADILGRKAVYTIVAAIMIVGALLSAIAPSFIYLVIARFVLGLGIGGDYPVSAVLMSEYSNRADRGRLVGLVFSMQAAGLIIGPLVGVTLLSSGIHQSIAWRLMLAFGAVPAAAVIYLRSKMPESPRFRASVQGESERAAAELHQFTNGAITKSGVAQSERRRLSLRDFLANGTMLRLILGTAGSWFLFDYAYYGNTISLPSILLKVSPNATIEAKLWLSLIIFVVFALPGYALAVWKIDKVGHRRLQLIGFIVIAACFLLLGVIPQLTESIVPFIGIFGFSYLFTEFGPNTTTFVLPSELFPVEMRTTGHGIAAGIGKFGAFVGVFLVPQLQDKIGLRGMLVVAGIAALLGSLLTLILPEPARRSLEEVSHHEFTERVRVDV